MSTKTNNTPNGWSLYSLNEFYAVLGNLSLPREFLTVKEQNCGYIHYGDIHTQVLPEIINSDTPISYLLNTKKISNIENYFLKQGDIIVVDASEDYDGVAKAVEINSIKNRKIVAGLHTIALRPLNKNSVASKFGPYLFKHPVVIKRLRAISQGTKVFSISFPLIQKVKFFLPPIEEQRRIVEVLECWDKGIELVKKLIEQKELQKKYLMQQLLSGTRRLKGFTQKWEKKPLGKLIKLYQGYPFKSETYSAQGQYKIITIANVKQGYLDLAKFSTIQILPPDILKYQQLDIGDILISMTGNVGRICQVNSKNCLLNQRVGKIEANLLDKEFLYYILQLPNFLNVMFACAQGGAQANLSTKDIYHYVLFYPSDTCEQQAIAEVLSSADKEIDLLKQKLAKLEAQKKGLMQVLLTGKVRLK